MRLLSQTTEGVYANDPYENIHPDLLARYHGVDRPDDGPGIADHENLPVDLEPLAVEPNIIEGSDVDSEGYTACIFIGGSIEIYRYIG